MYCAWIRPEPLPCRKWKWHSLFLQKTKAWQRKKKKRKQTGSLNTKTRQPRRKNIKSQKRSLTVCVPCRATMQRWRHCSSILRSRWKTVQKKSSRFRLPQNTAEWFWQEKLMWSAHRNLCCGRIMRLFREQSKYFWKRDIVCSYLQSMRGIWMGKN